MSTSSCFWPKDAIASSKVQFIVPNEWTKDNDQQQLCCIDYDERRHLVHIVQQQQKGDDGDDEQAPQVVLDCFDPNDMIGAKLEVEIETKTETNNSGNDTATAATGDEASSSNNDNNRAYNEPSSDTLKDNTGKATLHIYSYPKVDNGESGKSSFFGTWFRSTKPTKPSSSHTVPNPNYYIEKKEKEKEQPSKDAAKQQQPAKPKPRAACHRRFQLAPTEDFAEVSELVKALQQLACPSSNNKQQNHRNNRKLLVLINPHAGPKKNGEQIYYEQVQPVLEDQAGIECDAVVTQSAEHAQRRLRQQQSTDNNGDTDLSEYDGLVVLGGDGTLHHAVNTILNKRKNDGRELLSKIPIAVIGCGSANGFMASVCYASSGNNNNHNNNNNHYFEKENCGIVEMCYLICKGNTVPVDLATYQTTNNSYTGFLTYSYAMVADIDIESERIHWMGEIRFDLWAVIRILFLRYYSAKFSYLPPPPPVDVDNTNTSTAADADLSANMPALTEDLPADNWKTIDDDFILLWASNVSHAATTTLQSPFSRMDDGVFQIMMVRKSHQISRYKLIQILLGISDGTHINLDGVETLACTAFRLQPHASGSFNDVDGEVVEDGPIQAQVLPSRMHTYVMN